MNGLARDPTLGPMSRLLGRDRLSPDVVAFQDPIDQICAEPPPRFLRGTHHFVLALLLAIVLAASLLRVDVVVVGTGRLVTATPPVMLQPMERAIVREVRVRPGDEVARGQIVATLDPTFVEADTASLANQLRETQAEVRRLEAEADGRAFEPIGESDALQGKLFAQRQAEYATRLRVFDEDVQRLDASLRTMGNTGQSLGRELQVARSVEGMRSTLLQMQSGSKLTLLEAQSARMRLERDQQEAGDRLLEVRHGVESRQAERQSFVDNWRRELLEALVAARAEQTRATAALAKASRLHDLVVLTAPVDGVVLDVAARSAGSVLHEAEALVTIVPQDAKLVAEVMISSADVGYATPGAETKVKVDAFPFQRHGMLAGRLQSIAEESFSGPGDMASAGLGTLHRGRVELLATRLSHVPPGARLFPGMAVIADIRAGSRSVLSYFLYPLTRGLSESLREP